MFRRILVPLDGSPRAEAALPHARQIARAHNAELRLLRVIVFPALDAPAAESARFHGEMERLRAAARAYVEHLAAELRADGFAATAETCEGNVPAAILDDAVAHKCDLVAMATQGHSGSARWLMGSIADRVAHSAPVPVLLIRPHYPLAEIKRRREARVLVAESRWI